MTNWITEKEAEKISGVHRKSLHRWHERNPNLMKQDGRYWTVNETELRRIMEARKVLKGE